MPEFIGRPKMFEDLANALVRMTAEKYAPIEQGLKGVGQGIETYGKGKYSEQQKGIERQQEMSDRVKLEGIKLISKALDEGRLDVLEKKGIDLNALLPGLMKTQGLAPGVVPKSLPGQGAFPQGLQPQPITTQMVPGILQGQTPATIRPISPLQGARLGMQAKGIEMKGKNASEKKEKESAKSGVARQKEIASVVNQADSAARAKADKDAKNEYGEMDKAKWTSVYRQHFDSRIKAGLPDITPDEYKKIMGDMFPEQQAQTLDGLLLDFLKGGK